MFCYCCLVVVVVVVVVHLCALFFPQFCVFGTCEQIIIDWSACERLSKINLMFLRHKSYHFTFYCKYYSSNNDHCLLLFTLLINLL